MWDEGIGRESGLVCVDEVNLLRGWVMICPDNPRNLWIPIIRNILGGRYRFANITHDVTR